MCIERFLKISIAVEICPVRLTIANNLLFTLTLGIGDCPERFFIALGNSGQVIIAETDADQRIAGKNGIGDLLHKRRKKLGSGKFFKIEKEHSTTIGVS